MLLFSSCENSPLKRSVTLDIGGDTITLENAAIHDVKLTSNPGEFEPATLKARSGDVLRFVTADARAHVVSFDVTTLPAATRQLFEQKSQLRSPPLVVEGTSWIVSLENAQPGTYNYSCETHRFKGAITVK